jgi:hypothetical protein
MTNELKYEICRATSNVSKIKILDYKDRKTSSGNVDFTLSLNADGCNFEFVGKDLGNKYSLSNNFQKMCSKGTRSDPPPQNSDLRDIGERSWHYSALRP